MHTSDSLNGAAGLSAATALDGTPVGARRHWAARINAVLVPLVEVPAALLVVAEIVVLLCRHPGPLCLPQTDRVVGRAGRHSVPVARHAGCSDRLPAWRAHAHDGHRRDAAAACTSIPRCGRGRRSLGLYPARDPPGLRVRRRRGLCHHPGARDRQLLARRGAARGHRSYAARGAAPTSERE